MNSVLEWFAGGGTTMIALCAVAVVLCYLILERYISTTIQIREIASGVVRRDTFSGMRRMGIIRACIIIAPLLGLLGTVTGMIDSFDSILHGGYVAAMSRGISKALLTTQYGLAIAAPGLLAEQVLLRRMDRLENLRQAAHLAAEGGE